MTDTRKEFERAVSNLGWAFDYIGDGQYGSHTIQFANKLWQACQSLNDKRIEQLLAVIAKKDEALQAAVDCGMVPISSAKEGGAARHSQQVIIADKIREALALHPADVEMVESGYLDEFDNFEKSIKPWMQEEPNVTWQPVYTIKTKE